jgi:outer membrane murein-binding lipoprotein Lpp
MMLRVRVEALKARIEALGMDAAAARAMMPLAGEEARRGVAAARRSAREVILVAGFMVMEYRGIVLV